MKTVVGKAYAVRHDVPLPAVRSGRRPNESKYPFESMGIGDSFTVSADNDMRRTVARLSSACRIWGSQQMPKRMFTVRQLPDTNEVGVWRIE